MKTAIVGSRKFSDYKKFKAIIDLLKSKNQIDMIISGGAAGIDFMAYQYAIENGITFVCHPPIPSDGYPNKFFRRNLRIIEQSEFVIALPTKSSKGTLHSISLAKRLKKKLVVIDLPETP